MVLMKKLFYREKTCQARKKNTFFALGVVTVAAATRFFLYITSVVCTYAVVVITLAVLLICANKRDKTEIFKQDDWGESVPIKKLHPTIKRKNLNNA